MFHQGIRLLASICEFLQKQIGQWKHYAHLLTDLQDCTQDAQESVSEFLLRIETCLSKLVTEISITNQRKTFGLSFRN